jgi:hypothetical protein
MKLKMMIYSLTPGSLQILLRILSFAVLLIPASASSQFSFSSGSDLFISEGSYLYTEQPVTITITITETPRPKSSTNSQAAAPQPKVLKAPSKALASGPSAESKRNSSFRYIPSENTQHFSTPGNLYSLAVLGTSLLKLQQKTIPPSFILYISARRDQEKRIHITSHPFQLKHITINHFGRPPPVFQS